jgi:uncharacterized protein
MTQIPKSKRIVIAGGTGAIGQNLARYCVARGDEVVVLSRQAPAVRDGVRYVRWDGVMLGEWSREIDGAHAIVNLAGQSVNCRLTAENRRIVLASRVNAIQALRSAIDIASVAPQVWLNAAGKEFYGDAGDAICDEETPARPGVLSDLCAAWEEAFTRTCPPTVRPGLLRIGIVLDDTGALGVLRKLTSFYLGGAAGSGRQFVSWIHRHDMTRMLCWAIDTDAVHGTYNATAPEPVRNADFMRTLRRVMRRPWCPPVPGPLLRLGAALAGSQGELVLEGNFVHPKRALNAGFTFEFAAIETALRDLLQNIEHRNP